MLPKTPASLLQAIPDKSFVDYCVPEIGLQVSIAAGFSQIEDDGIRGKYLEYRGMENFTIARFNKRNMHVVTNEFLSHHIAIIHELLKNFESHYQNITKMMGN